jgi:hypothetical protein
MPISAMQYTNFCLGTALVKESATISDIGLTAPKLEETYYETLEYEWLSYFLIWAPTYQKTAIL